MSSKVASLTCFLKNEINKKGEMMVFEIRNEKREKKSSQYKLPILWIWS